MAHPITPSLYDCLVVTQPIGTFYIVAIPAARILPLLGIERRGLSADERDRVQRALDSKRRSELGKYVLQPDATLPTSVTLSADSDYVHVVQSPGASHRVVLGLEMDADAAPEAGTIPLEVNDGGKVRRFVEVPDGDKVALVIDGQHRVEGLRSAGADRQGSPLAEFCLPFALMFDMSPEDMAEVFVTINSTQRKVDSSHIADLFALSTHRSPQRTAHLIAVALNEKEGSAFKQGLKMLGRRSQESEFLSQGSFCKYVTKLFSRTKEEDERRLKEGEPLQPDVRAPLRPYFIQARDELILRIVDNFFSAVRDVYSLPWATSPEGYLMRKTVGFSALIQFLIKVLPVALDATVQDASRDAFIRVLKSVRQAVPDEEWEVGKFSSSEAEATTMSKRMLAAVQQQLTTLLKGAPAVA